MRIANYSPSARGVFKPIKLGKMFDELEKYEMPQNNNPTSKVCPILDDFVD